MHVEPKQFPKEAEGFNLYRRLLTVSINYILYGRQRGYYS